MKIRFQLTLFCVFALITHTHAQNNGTLLGTVRDKNTQRPLEGATLRLVGTSAMVAQTDAAGRFSLTVPVGAYTLTTTMVGYETATNYNLNIGSGNDLIINLELDQAAAILEEVTVVNRRNRSVRAADMVTPMSTQRLTTEEIKLNPGGNFDVSKVIQALPGVAGGFSANRNDIIIRGGAPNENVYYLDGIEIPVLNHFQTQGASGGANGILNVSFIEDVQLTSSAFDARYDNALASTFVIKQRNGNPNEFAGNLRLSGTEFAATLEGPISKKTTFIASARRSYLQLLFELLDLPIRPNYWDFQYKISHQANEKTSFNFIGLGAIDQFSMVAPANSSPENEYILRANPAINQWNYTVGASMKRLLQNGYYTVALSRNLFNNRADRFEDNIDREENRTLGLRSFEAENKLRVDVNKYADGWKWAYGAMVQYVRYDLDLFNRLATDELVQSESAIDFFKYGLFGQVSKRIWNERLLLSLGLRTDMNTYTATGNNPLKTASPRLSLSYQLNPKVDLTASVGKYHKIPTYTALGFTDNANNRVNRSMDYIGSLHYALGVQYLPEDAFRITLEGFYKDYNNYPISLRNGISLANLGADFNTIGNEPLVSSGTGKVYGAELFIQQKLLRRLFYVLSATAYRAQFAGLDSRLTTSSWDYAYIVSSTVGYKLGRGWEIGAKYRIAGGQPYTPFDMERSRTNYLITGTGTLDYARLNTERLPLFNQLDLRVDKRFNFRGSALSIFVDAQNILLYKTPGLPNYTFERSADNSGFATSDGLPLSPGNTNAIPLILDNRSATVVPSLGFIFEF